MKIRKEFSLLLGLFIAISCNTESTENNNVTATADSNQEFYQIRRYSFETSLQAELTDKYLEEAFVPALKRLGISKVGVLKPKPVGDSVELATWVIIPFQSLEEFQNLESGLSADETYRISGSEYLEAPFDNPPYQRIESLLLEAFTDWPQLRKPDLQAERSRRVYELRSYQSATEELHRKKVDMFNAGGEIALFDKLGFNPVFFARILSGPLMPNLMYMICFENEEDQKNHWEAFVNSPEWTQLKQLPEYLNTVSHIDKYFLIPTDFSDF